MFFVWLFIVGTIFWSFGSVLLLRLDGVFSRKMLQGILIGRSTCPWCHCHLSRWKLIPLVWWSIQWGRCQSCHQQISTLYPVCEIVSGLIFVWWGLLFMDFTPLQIDYRWRTMNTGLSLHTILLLIIWRLLWLILVWDIYTYQLHTKIWLLLCAFVSVWMWVIGDRRLVGGGAIGLLVFTSLYLFARVYVRLRFGDNLAHDAEWIGMGDVMIAPIIGSLIAFSLIQSHVLWLQSFFLIDTSVIGIIQLIIVFILGTCILGLIWYTVSRLFFSSSHHSPDWSEGMGPVIPFLPSMIMMYWIIVYLSM